MPTHVITKGELIENLVPFNEHDRVKVFISAKDINDAYEAMQERVDEGETPKGCEFFIDKATRDNGEQPHPKPHVRLGAFYED